MSDRNLRMSDVFDFEAFTSARKEIVGLGAIGGMVCKQLSYLGAENVFLWDFDEAAEHNMGNQGFGPAQLGRPKVDVRLEEAATYTDTSTWSALNSRWAPTAPSAIYFVCVDSLAARKEIYDALPEGSIIVDTRMLALEYCVYCVNGKHSGYEESLDPEGLVEGSCTTRSTLHAANLAATLAVTIAMQYLSGRTVPYRVKGELNFYEQATDWP